MGLTTSFWKNKRVLVTGHTGFKGTWLSFWLIRLGANVKGISLPPETDPNMFDLVINKGDMDSAFGDIRDLDYLKKAIADFKPEIIIHMAAQAIVRESYENPIETFNTNVMGTANVLESARYADTLGAVLCITSDKCYENREWHWKYREIDPVGGHDPYSASKGCAELVASSYRNSFFPKDNYSNHGVGIATARAGNVIGGGDWSRDRLIPDCVRAFSKNEDVLIRNPKAVRPWQFILDLLYGYMILTEQLFKDGETFSGSWNFGPVEDNEKPVGFILDEMKNLWGEDASWKLDEGSNPHEASYLKLDSSKARRELGWAPALHLQQSLAYVTEWYKSFYAGENTAEVTEQQLSSYMKHRKTEIAS